MTIPPDPAAELAALLGHAPAEGAALASAWLATPLGPMIAVADRRRLHLLEFADRKALPAQMRRLSRQGGGRVGLGRTPVTDRAEAQLTAWFAGTRAGFDLPLEPGGTPFQHLVWQELQRIPPGTTISYAELARRIGRPAAVRAAASANGANRIALVIPCHRVLGTNGGLTGYGGGLWRKQALIRHESDRFGGQTAPDRAATGDSRPEKA
ncbi:methylated-DNA-[protein]-cysteine S-methyltransferase [Paracoccus aminovorans]|uniref:methylated-DNA--[protein]-cysteine S-methyltransferase n=1 Tax=Paracoccus aminovorans TaxID=34004 RepID=A0A1I3DR54_9RHOB|nr:methylated-DNA--[protein]-cysteine S-methyltransferase [Paracoccus aminovorans]CQR85325.1 methylated-DNA-protein-cysteinemethyltransferase [Paracoccus aminovorans]SFH89192.1 methylated-DNA-[protein]-cysteine S-methyltransferase [Paracoccus aminovorans]